MRAHVGTSGWNYNHWKSVFYPEGLKSKDWLAYYVQRFDTVELNVTFYREVKAETFRKWYEATPVDFQFSVKMSRFITHIKRLAIGQESIDRFNDNIVLLQEKLGVVLIQLPPSLKFDHDRVARFFDLLDPAFRYTVEARNQTFVCDAFYALLKERNIAWCISESAGRYPYDEAITADFLYLRLHGREKLYGSSYRDDELSVISDNLKNWKREAYVYFDNDYEGFAPQNALTLRRMLME
jgi:uncharacterized protein YecE (DUF72 family)